MTHNKLPPLPKHASKGPWPGDPAFYTADQMHAYAAEALRQSQSLPAGAVADMSDEAIGRVADRVYVEMRANGYTGAQGGVWWNKGMYAAGFRAATEQALQADAREKGEVDGWRVGTDGGLNIVTPYGHRVALDESDMSEQGQAIRSVLRRLATQPAQASEKDDRDWKATCDDFVADYKPAGAEAVDVSKELMACPFCGEFDGEISDSSVLTINGGQKKAVYCNGCFCEGPTANTFYDAISAWNRRATHPQPVTPSGGEVGQPWAWAVEVDFSGHRPNGRFLFDDKDEATAYFQWREGSCNKPTLHSLYLHPPVADAALDSKRLDWLEQEVADKSAVWLLTAADQRFVQVRTVDGVDNCPLAPTVRAAIDAALNQRGGGDHG